MYTVDDIDSAVEHVRAAGDRSIEPQRNRYGVATELIDDRSTRFSLGET